MRTLATPAEFEELMASLGHLEHLDREGKAAIARMVFEVVAPDCPSCREGVRRCDPRRLVDDRLLHLDCVSDAGSGAAPGGRDGGRGVTRP
jgi:hypothetical protein